MKKLIFILFALFAGFSTNSCIIEDGDTRPKATVAGKLIFDNTEMVISNCLAITDIALKLNAYAVAPTDQKTILEDRYFPKYKPRYTTNNWVLINSPYSFVTDGKSLDVIGSKWSISINQKDYMVGTTIVLKGTIECVGDKQWKISTMDAYTYQTVSNSVIIAKASQPSITNTFVLYDFTVSGAGKYLSNDSYSGSNSLSVDYTILTPMKFVQKNPVGNSEMSYPVYSDIMYNFSAVGGKMEMVVGNTGDATKRDLIVSDLTSSIGNNIINRITFKGITEVW